MNTVPKVLSLFLRSRHTASALLLAVLLSACLTPAKAPYLTWQGDTGETITINYQTRRTPETIMAYYDVQPRNGDPQAYAFQEQGTHTWIPGQRATRHVNSIELTSLTPGATYYFIAGDKKNGYTEEKKFRTIPKDATTLRFITGGDMSPLPRAKWLLRQAAKFDPMFAVIGGDIAYDGGKLYNSYRWDIWLRRWTDLMVTSDGALIPMVLAIGNHEVDSAKPDPASQAPFYFGYLPQGGSTYFVRRFGANAVLYVLDSGHVAEYDGPQVEWLRQQLEANKDVPNQLAVYHVPLYPSFRSPEDSRTVAGRTHWLPLFDQYGLDIGFENHDHTHKRTHRLKNNAIDESGTLYLGDGCFGVQPRNVDDPNRWYLANSSNTPHFWVIDITGEDFLCRAVNMEGQVFDRYPEPEKTSQD